MYQSIDRLIDDGDGDDGGGGGDVSERTKMR